jgi:beta-glucosidase-like glycosyl hydrolase
MTNAPEHRAVALDVARAGIVLLKNEQNILPIGSFGHPLDRRAWTER